MKRIDLVTAFSIFMLYMFVIISNFVHGINFAILNFIFSILPMICIIFKFRIKSKKNYFVLIFLFMSILKMISTLVNINHLSNSQMIIDFCYCISFFISFFGYIIFKDNYEKAKDYKEGFKYTSLIIIIFTLVFSLYNIIVNAGQFALFSNVALRYSISFSSFYGNRNNFSIMLLIGIIVLHFSYYNKYIENKIIYIVLLIFFIINLLLTLSRTAIISLLLYYFIYYFFSKKNNKQRFMLLVFFIGGIVILNNHNVVNFMNNFIIRKEVGLSSRTDIWIEALKLAKNCFVIGYGETYSSNLLYKQIGNFYFHNVLIKNIVCDGLLFGIMYIILCLNNLKRVLRLNKNKIICLASIISIFAYGMTEHFDIFYFGLMNFTLTFIFMYLPVISGGVENE